MSLLFSPFESYFDRDGKPTAAGQQLLARIGQLVPANGADGQVLQSNGDGTTEWVTVVVPPTPDAVSGSVIAWMGL